MSRQERARHGAGHTLSDVWRLRSGKVPRAPDGVVWPACEDQVKQLLLVYVPLAMRYLGMEVNVLRERVGSSSPRVLGFISDVTIDLCVVRGADRMVICWVVQYLLQLPTGYASSSQSRTDVDYSIRAHSAFCLLVGTRYRIPAGTREMLRVSDSSLIHLWRLFILVVAGVQANGVGRARRRLSCTLWRGYERYTSARGALSGRRTAPCHQRGHAQGDVCLTGYLTFGTVPAKMAKWTRTLKYSSVSDRISKTEFRR